MLRKEFLKPMGLTNYRPAKEVDVPAQRIGEIIAGRRGITADTDLRLSPFFGLSDGWWLRLQAIRHADRARRTYQDTSEDQRPPRRDSRTAEQQLKRGFPRDNNSATIIIPCPVGRSISDVIGCNGMR